MLWSYMTHPFQDSFLAAKSLSQRVWTFKKIFYLFIWLLRVLVVACGGLHCFLRDLSLLRADSWVVVCELSSSVACGILVSDQGMNLSPALQGRFLTTGPPRRFFFLIFKIFFIFGHSTCWILIPWPGIRPTPPALEAQSLNHWATREFPSMNNFNINRYS